MATDVAGRGIDVRLVKHHFITVFNASYQSFNELSQLIILNVVFKGYRSFNFKVCIALAIFNNFVDIMSRVNCLHYIHFVGAMFLSNYIALQFFFKGCFIGFEL